MIEIVHFFGVIFTAVFGIILLFALGIMIRELSSEGRANLLIVFLLFIISLFCATL